MRGPWTILAAFALVGCNVPLAGAPCDSDENCPAGQRCGADKKCVESSSAGSDGGGSNANDGGNGDGGSNCPAPGSTAGASCSASGALGCDSGNVNSCTQEGVCLVWRLSKDCATQGLGCGTSGSLTQCVCPPNVGTDYYVDPFSGSDATNSLGPTGVLNPPQCRFKALTPALARASANGKVIAMGATLKPEWQPGHSYALGDLVTPSLKNLNHHAYRCTVGGLSGTVEPTWPAPGTAVSESTGVTWTEAGPAEAASFTAEQFPLTVRSGVTLATIDCPSGGGTFCDLRGYAISFSDPAASSALVLEGGAALSGFAIWATVPSPASSAVSCSQGTVNIDYVLAGGADANGNRLMGTGLSIGGSCAGTVNLGAFYGFSGAAIRVNSTSGSRIALNSVFSGQSQVGLEIRGGSVAVASLAPNIAAVTPRFWLNDYGIILRTQGATQAMLDASHVRVTSNTYEGLVLENTTGAAPSATFTDGEIDNNGLAPNATMPASSGIRSSHSTGSLTLSGAKIHDNGIFGLLVEGGTATLQNSASGANSSFTANGKNGGPGIPSGGVGASGGTVNATSIDTSFNTGAGLGASAVTGGTAHPSVMSSGQTAKGNTATGIYVGPASSITLSGAVLANNQGPGLMVEGGSATLGAGSNVSGNGAGSTGRSAGVQVRSGDLIISGTAAGPIPIASNAGSGIEISTIGRATIGNVDVSQNSLNGVHVHQAGNLSLGSSFIRGNAGIGVHLQGDMGGISATIANCDISMNIAQGLVIEQSAGWPTSTTLVNNRIYQNALNLPQTLNPAGILFRTSSTLQGFIGNQIHDNGGNQLQFQAPENNGKWRVSSFACDCNANQIFGYQSIFSSVGIFSANAAGSAVDATNVYWQNSPPIPGTDYSNNSVTVMPSCSPPRPLCP